MTGSAPDAVVRVRDADCYPVKVGCRGGDVIVQVAKTAPLGRVRLDAAAREDFLRAFTAMEALAGAHGDADAKAGGCGCLPGDTAAEVEWFLRDLPDTVIDGRDAVRLQCGHGTVFEVGITVTVRQVGPGAAPPGPRAGGHGVTAAEPS